MAPLEIRRDVDGIAHVRAASTDDAFFGQGYAAASDRCFQIEADRRRAIGTWAGVVGAAGLASDTLHVRMGLAEAARRDLSSLAATTVAMLEAYAAGVSARFAELTADELPPELTALSVERLDPWEPWHSIAVYKFRHMLMGTAQTKIHRSWVLATAGPEVLRALWPDAAAHDDLPPADLEAAVAAMAAVPLEEAASNNLALAGSRTASGMPIVAGDPHRGFDLPNVYWQNHLTAGDLDVIGLSFPGVPGFPHFGHNAEAAWCITHGMADDQDVFVEQVRRRDDTVELRRDAGWVTVPLETVEVHVAGGSVARVETFESPDGARFVAGDLDAGWAICAAWTGTWGPDTTFDALEPMMRAGSVAELDRAMAPWVIPVNNVVMADRAGSIAYRMRGLLARRDQRNGWALVPAATGDHVWQGLVDDVDLPRVVDPDEGYVVTANEDLGHDHLYVSHDWAHPARGQRITQVVSARTDWTAEAVATEVLGDVESLVAPLFCDRFTTVTGLHGVVEEARRRLASWDHRMHEDSVAATIYTAARIALLERVMSRLLGDRHPVVGGTVIDLAPGEVARSRWNRLVDLVATDHDAIDPDDWGAALTAGVARLRAELGDDTDTWTWGRVHHSAPYHPLAQIRPDLAGATTLPAPRSVGGDSDTVRCTGISPPDLVAMRGSVARYVFDLSDWDASGWIVPHGVHGDGRSPHFDDQGDRWAAVVMAPMRWSPDVIDDATEEVLHIER